MLSPNDDEVWNVGAGQTVTWLGAEPADLWLSSNGGVSYDLLRHDVGGESFNALNLLVPNAPTKFARVKVTPVDGGVTGSDESDSLFTIQTSGDALDLRLDLFDGQGRLAARRVFPSAGGTGRVRLTWNPSEVSAGSYFLRVASATGTSQSRRIVFLR